MDWDSPDCISILLHLLSKKVLFLLIGGAMMDQQS